MALCLLAACAGCGGARYARRWDGRRGYDGNGDYGYDLAASRAEARSYRAGIAQTYKVPGTADDPWGPYIAEAASRFQVPERWIREVMRQESGGHLYDPDGSPITSSAGAMGLMQVMPHTYDMLRERYALGSDPYDPRDNILAGTAYIRDMYAVYGAPAFLAAYNAGPDRLDAYLSGGSPLPDETTNYLASVAPRLGTEIAMTGPLAAYAGATVAAGSGQGTTPGGDGVFAGGGMTGQDYAQAGRTGTVTEDPSDQAFDGGGLVTSDAPTGVLSGQNRQGAAVTTASLLAPIGSGRSYVDTTNAGPGQGTDRGIVAHPLAAPAAVLMPVATTATRSGAWGIQVGAFPDPAESQAAIATARARGGALLFGTQQTITTVQRASTLYRARLVGLSAANAIAACGKLSRDGMDCFTVPPGP